jgi:hypothetical protein
MKTFRRPEHQNLVAALRLTDRDLLARNRCWFGGGTAIVLRYGEYRISLDVDFLCSDAGGYRELRNAAVRLGHKAFFPPPIEPLREFHTDQYGLRTAFRYEGQLIKFEIVREGRIDLSGEFDDDTGLPTLSTVDMFAEKLLANADRCQDRAVAYRDAIDLGMLILNHNRIPDEAVAKSEAAYGADIGRKAQWVTGKLAEEMEIIRSAEGLRMDPGLANAAIDALRNECRRLWPDRM